MLFSIGTSLSAVPPDSLENNNTELSLVYRFDGGLIICSWETLH